MLEGRTEWGWGLNYRFRFESVWPMDSGHCGHDGKEVEIGNFLPPCSGRGQLPGRLCSKYRVVMVTLYSMKNDYINSSIFWLQSDREVWWLFHFLAVHVWRLQKVKQLWDQMDGVQMFNVDNTHFDWYQISIATAIGYRTSYSQSMEEAAHTTLH